MTKRRHMETRTIKNPKGLAGGKGLILALISQAISDCFDENKDLQNDAWCFFLSEAYERYCLWLGIPIGTFPEEIDKIAIKDGVNFAFDDNDVLYFAGIGSFGELNIDDNHPILVMGKYA